MATESDDAFPLFGFERNYCMNPEGSTMIVHTIALRGAISAMLPHLPEALRRTFNKHPKMRVQLVDPLAFRGCVGRHLTSEDVETRRLLQVLPVDGSSTSDWWHAHAEQQCNTTIDREND